jgi:hypothetical protein
VSCEGLTRASMMHFALDALAAVLVHLIIDCRVTPGNDAG